MAPRAFGALLALVAALLLVASLAGALAPNQIPGWWDGHPQVNSKTFEHKAIHVGLLGAYGCNLGETVTCEPLDNGALLEPIGIAELAALGLVTLTTIVMLVSIWRIGDRRKGLGRIVVLEALMAIAIAGAWFALGPNIKAGNASASVPIGFGLYAFAGGAVSALIAGMLAQRVEREPIRLKTSKRMPAPQPPPEPLAAFDVRDLVPLRPAGSSIPPTPAYSVQVPQSLLPATPAPPVGTGPHAPISRPMATPPAPPKTGPHPPITGPHPPLAGHVPTPVPPQPLFENAPQLRPLYDMANVGVVPAPVPPKLPERAPTPIPRASLLETTEVPKSAAKPPPIASTRTKAASLPPMMRQVTPPSRGAASAPDRAMSKQPTIAHAVPPMPSMVPARAETDPEPSTTVEIDAEAKAKWKAEQARKAAATAAVNAKLASAARTPAPPPPEITVPARPTPMPKSSPPPSPPDTDQNPVAQPDPTEPVQARPTTAYSAQTRAALADTGALTPLAPELADTRIAPADDSPSLRPTEQHDAVAFGGDTAPQTDVMNAVEPAPTLSEPAPGPPPPAATPAVTIDKADFDRTLERNPPPPNRPSAPSLKAPPVISVPKTIAPKPMPPMAAAAPPQRPTPSPDAKPRPPLSTAPALLPPPKQAQPAQSGPTPACPQCEAPMAWVDEHLRFYCKQCRMYF